jgi:hypothetical protein
MSGLSYRTEISARPTGGFLVQRFANNALVDRYTTQDLSLGRRNKAPWIDRIVGWATTPLGTTAEKVHPELFFHVPGDNVFDRLADAQAELYNSEHDIRELAAEIRELKLTCELSSEAEETPAERTTVYAEECGGLLNV